MKKIMPSAISIVILIGILIFGFSACQKITKQEQAIKHKTSPLGVVPTMGRFQDSVSVTTHGYMKFVTTSNFNDFLDYVLFHTHREVKDYLDSIGFTSIGDSLYDSSYDPNLVSPTEAVNYLYNPDYVFEIEGIVFRPVSSTSCTTLNFQFLLAMADHNIDDSSYAHLAAGVYDSTTMNKFATGLHSNIDLPDFMASQESGYNETVAESCPSSTEVRDSALAGRPIFGHSSTDRVTDQAPHYNPGTGHCEQCHERLRTITTYIFWIPFPGKENVVGDWCNEVAEGLCH